MQDPSKPLAPEDLVGAPAPADESSGERLQTMPLGPSRPQRTLPAVGAPEAIDAVDPDRADRLLGRILAGRYQIKRVLGRGGMGIVYEGVHVTVGRALAIKVLRADLARSTEAVARFHREAKAAAAIGSEHIVEVFDFGYTDEGDAYIAMELLDGEDLGRIIRREGTIPEPRAAGFARQVARALESAHAKGIIHRDLKSENVFVLRREGADFVKLLDFGISKVSEGDEGRGPMTSEGVVMGTPHYMAPEQAISALETDHRIDIYALGCLMYEMLTGRVPFTGRNPVEVVFKHVHEAPIPPSALRPGLSPELEAVVLKALAKKREDRYATAAELLQALDAARPSLVNTTVPPGSINPTPTGPDALPVVPPQSRTVAPPPAEKKGLLASPTLRVLAGVAAGGILVSALSLLRQPRPTEGASLPVLPPVARVADAGIAAPPVHEPAHEPGTVMAANAAGEGVAREGASSVGASGLAAGAGDAGATVRAGEPLLGRRDATARRDRATANARAGSDAGAGPAEGSHGGAEGDETATGNSAARDGGHGGSTLYPGGRVDDHTCAYGVCDQQAPRQQH